MTWNWSTKLPTNIPTYLPRPFRRLCWAMPAGPGWNSSLIEEWPRPACLLSTFLTPLENTLWEKSKRLHRGRFNWAQMVLSEKLSLFHLGAGNRATDFIWRLYIKAGAPPIIHDYLGSGSFYKVNKGRRDLRDNFWHNASKIRREAPLENNNNSTTLQPQFSTSGTLGHLFITDFKQILLRQLTILAGIAMSENNTFSLVGLPQIYPSSGATFYGNTAAIRPSTKWLKRDFETGYQGKHRWLKSFHR